MLSLEELLSGVVLPIDKPRQWSSFQAVNKVKSVVRRLYGVNKFKIGHAGTLDPLASGLLLVCIGKATKQIDFLQSGVKEYSGTMVIGAETPCYDLERPISRYLTAPHLTLDDVEQAAKSFVGDISQVPPLFSAVKVDGQRAYSIARADSEEVEVTARQVHVYDFRITAFRPADPSFVPPAVLPFDNVPATGLYQNPQGVVPVGLAQADFRITCGKGTYIRSLARDMGVELSSCAFLSALRRERAGDYTVDKACPIDDVEAFLSKL